MRAKRGGGLLPLGGNGEDFGGHKGYGLGLLVDIFSGVLSASANTTLLYPKTPDGTCFPSRVGHFFGALRVDLFRPLEGFKKDMDDFDPPLEKLSQSRGAGANLHSRRKRVRVGAEIPGRKAFRCISKFSRICGRLPARWELNFPCRARPVLNCLKLSLVIVLGPGKKIKGFSGLGFLRYKG